MSTLSSPPQVVRPGRTRTGVGRVVALVAVVVLLAPDAALSQRTPPAGSSVGTGTARLRNAPQETPTPKTPTPPPQTPAPPSADSLFDPAELHVIQITMKPEDWQALTENFTLNTYYPADLQWKDQQATTVGVRSRGSGSRSKDKPGLRIDFNRYMPDQRFLGLKSVVLANAVQDPSMLRYRLAFTFFARMGVPVSRAVHAKLYVNGNYMGLYQLVEAVDKVMLPRVFDDPQSNAKEDDGYLYEYVWRDAYQWTYLGSDLDAYADKFEPKTHDTEAPADLYGRVEEMIRIVNEARDSEFEQRASEYFDLNRLATYLAVDSFLAQADGFLGDWGVNNIYLYQFENQKRWTFLPWDQDLAFYDTQFEIFRHVDANVLASRLLALPGARKTYLDTLLACASLAMTPESQGSTMGWFEAEMRREVAQVKEASIADRHKPYPDSDVEATVTRMIAFAKDRGPFVINEVNKARSARTAGRR